MPHFQEIDVEYDPGTRQRADARRLALRLRKLHRDYDPTDRVGA